MLRYRYNWPYWAVVAMLVAAPSPVIISCRRPFETSSVAACDLNGEAVELSETRTSVRFITETERGFTRSGVSLVKQRDGSGALMLVTQWRNGRQDGISVYFHDDGEIESVKRYQNGRYVEMLARWDRDGKQLDLEQVCSEWGSHAGEGIGESAIRGGTKESYQEGSPE